MDMSKNRKKGIVSILVIVILLLGIILSVVAFNYMPITKSAKSYNIDKFVDSSLPPGSVYVNIGDTDSMLPTLDSNNKVICELSPNSINIGDIIVFKDYSNDYVIHRVIKIFSDGYQTKGDNNLFIDKRISKEQVYCKVKTILF